MNHSAPRRSRAITLVLLTSTAIALAGCEAGSSRPADFPVFRTVAQCSGYYEAFACERYQLRASSEHLRTAPRYASLDVCNRAHGTDACVAEQPNAAEGASWYLPQMLGFIVSRTEGEGEGTVKPVYASSVAERERQCLQTGTNCTQAKSGTSGGGGHGGIFFMHYSTGGSYVGPSAANNAVAPTRAFVSSNGGRSFSGGSAFSSAVSGRGGFGGSAGAHASGGGA